MAGGRPTLYTDELADSVSYIYCLKEPKTLEVRYVGKTDFPKDREYAHHSKQTGNSYRNKWIRSLLKEGEKPFFCILESVPVSEWKQAERKWISFYKNSGARLVNHDDGGIGAQSGGKQTRIHYLKRRLIGIYNSFPDKTCTSARNVAAKLRYVYSKIPNECPKRWKEIGLNV